MAQKDLHELVEMMGEVNANLLLPELQKYMQAENSVNKLIDF